MAKKSRNSVSLSAHGLVIFAPCDGSVIVCLDGASGEPVWMLNRHDLQYLIGHDGMPVASAATGIGSRIEVGCPSLIA